MTHSSMPTELKAFFAEIAAATPNDHAPRLIFADWLEERGDRLADVIRAACALVEEWHATRRKSAITAIETPDCRGAAIRVGLYGGDVGRRSPRAALRILGKFTEDEWEILMRLNFGVLANSTPRARIEWFLKNTPRRKRKAPRR
ncbi:MAG: TIGR02996 domain-containing protein [Planctomycetales bacterium]